mmetsp:Transcript_1370/g.4189  ORF Transcript_1370/g.4189 Transcript_1370/m.4189 type:complete len:606 (+) Transcript_1370:131-1948(+)
MVSGRRWGCASSEAARGGAKERVGRLLEALDAAAAAAHEAGHAAAAHGLGRALLLLRERDARGVRGAGVLRPRVADRLVDAEDDARGLRGRRQRVGLVEGRLPDLTDHGVDDALDVAVDAEPRAPGLVVLVAQRRQHVRRVKAAVDGQLARHDLQRLGEGEDDELVLAGDAERRLAQRLRDLHLDGAAAADDAHVHGAALDDHERVVDGAVRLLDVLLGAAAQHDGRRLGAGAAGEDVEALAADLLLLKRGARAADARPRHVEHRRLDDAARGLRDAAHVVVGHAAGAEQAAVGKVLRRQITDGQLGKDDVGARGDAEVELLVDDGPLGVDDALVRVRVRDAHLRILLFRLELQLDVQQQDLRVLERLWLLLEAGIGERLLEGDALDEERVHDGASGDLFHADEVQVQAVLRVQRRDGVDDHRREEALVVGDQLGVERRRRQHHEPVAPLRLGQRHRQLVQLVDRQARRAPHAAHDGLRVQAVLDERLHLLEDLAAEEHHGRRAVANLRVLRHANLRQHARRGVNNVQQLHNRRAVVGDGDSLAVVHQLVHAARAERRSDRVHDRAARINVRDELRLALRRVRAFAQQDDARLLPIPSRSALHRE